MFEPNLLIGIEYGVLATLVASAGDLSAWTAALLIVLGASLVLLYDWLRGSFN